MGLDMYLYARRSANEQAVLDACKDVKRYDDEDDLYLSRWSHSPDEEKAVTERVIDLVGLRPLVGEESNHVLVNPKTGVAQMPAIYWRKANAIHGWFVDNCQDGIDECQESEVHPEQLAALRAQCQRALGAYRAGDLHAAKEAMEPRPGFFFGTYDLDEWWAENMAYTISEIERVVHAASSLGGVEFFYHSSW